MSKSIRLLIPLTILATFVTQSLFSQLCPEGNIKFSNQDQIDSFPILYPDCVEIDGAIDITSDSGAIINLLGLSALTSIKGNLRIFGNPELKDLSGLNNLHSVEGWLYIGNNDTLSDLTHLLQLRNVGHFVSIGMNSSLESLSGLDSIKFDLLDQLKIVGNPHLSHCSVSSVCEHLSRYGSYQIYNNGPGCNYMEEIYNNCLFGPDSTAQYEKVCFEDGFENWSMSGDSLWPEDWTITYPGLWISDGKPNVERVNSLNEGNFAIVLRSNGPGFEGPERTTIERPLCDFPSRIDIIFTYTCRGDGYCEVKLGQSSTAIGGVNLRSIWNGQTKDTIKRTVVLNNIPVNPPFSGFQKIQFRTNPVYWTNGSWGISEFIIDSVVIREYNTSTGIELQANDISPLTIYPNPSPDIFYIHPEIIEETTLINVYSTDGQMIYRLQNDGKVDLSPFPAGMYFINIRYKDRWSFIKAIKM